MPSVSGWNRLHSALCSSSTAHTYIRGGGAHILGGCALREVMTFHIRSKAIDLLLMCGDIVSVSTLVN